MNENEILKNKIYLKKIKKNFFIYIILLTFCFFNSIYFLSIYWPNNQTGGLNFYKIISAIGFSGFPLLFLSFSCFYSNESDIYNFLNESLKNQTILNKNKSTKLLG